MKKILIQKNISENVFWHKSGQLVVRFVRCGSLEGKCLAADLTCVRCAEISMVASETCEAEATPATWKLKKQ